MQAIPIGNEQLITEDVAAGGSLGFSGRSAADRRSGRSAADRRGGRSAVDRRVVRVGFGI